MSLERKVYETRGEKIKDFLIGFFLLLVLNIIMGSASLVVTGAISSLSTSNPDLYAILSPASIILMGCCPLLVNVGLIIYFSRTRYWISLGMLGLFAAAFVLTLAAAIVLGVLCLVIIGQYNQL